jgi:uncharacterized protein YraI
MIQKYGFSLFDASDFHDWMTQQQVARTILYLQQHHTYIPDYSHFDGSNHFELQRSMQRVHRSHNGWSDIAQHFTIFPDGKVMTGRNLERSPAGIYGFNRHALCIENLGNFDLKGDLMRQEQRDAVVRVTASLAHRFAIPVHPDRIVYHHWFDLSTGVRTNGKGRTKSCPGTAFLGGNKVEDAESYFLPLVAAAQEPAAGRESVFPLYYVAVSSNTLVVRSQPSTTGLKVTVVEHGSILRVYGTDQGWYRIAARQEEWVWGAATCRVERAMVRGKQLPIRSGPGTHYRKLGALLEGQTVFLYERKNSWFRINAEPSKWVAGAFLALV